MKKKAIIVIGLGYGDEGKGLTTDFICRNSKNPLVIRFNGGHQAGHTVTLSNGRQHVFSNFGSGTFVGVSTYWSKFCTFSPSYLIYEINELVNFPVLYIDNYCPVTTHYDILYNRIIESSRGYNRFGSCGRGFGATINRVREKSILFSVKDLRSPKIYFEKIKEIRNYYKIKIEKYTNLKFSQFNFIREDNAFIGYIESLNDFIDSKKILLTNEKKIFSKSFSDSYIFEGAQGVLLDQVHGAFPYITKSNTTSKNALNLLYSNHDSKIDINIYYVTRSYLTRHGKGEFNLADNNYLIKNKWETNRKNEYQGKFKIGYLDLNLLQYAIDCDSIYSNSLSKNIVITCIDQLPDNMIKYISKKKLKVCEFSKLTSRINCKFERVYFSFAPCSNKMSF
jgi:adenylosuccinate synthase